MRRVALIVCLLLCTSSFALAQQRRTWAFRDNGWREINRAPTTGPVDDPVLDTAEVLLFREQYTQARKMLLAWEKTHKQSRARDRCLYLLAEAFFQSDDRIKSFYYCDELMDEYPESSLFQSALQKQFDIASAFLSGYKRVFIWWRILDASEEGIEMMYRIQQRAPGSPLAEKALLRTADYYFSDQEYDLAEDVYNAYAREYPHSPELPRVKLRAAFSSLAQFRGVRFDATAIINARAQLLDIEKLYPALAAEENVPTVIEQIDSAFARKLLETAEFYQRIHQPLGAVYEYRFLAATYPASPEAQTARDRLAKMPAPMLAEAPPPAAPGYAPATEPSADAR